MMFFPTKEELNLGLNKNWYSARKVSMPVFLNYFNTISLSYQEQLITRINRWFSPFESFFQEQHGFTPIDLTEIYLHLGKLLQERFDYLKDLSVRVDEQRRAFCERVEQGISIEDSRDMCDVELMKEFHKHITLGFHVEIRKLEEKFGIITIKSFVKLFSIERNLTEFKFYTENNPIENSPIWKKSDDYIFIPF